MSVSERLSRFDALQGSRRFKIVATALLVILGVVASGVWLAVVHAPITRDAVRQTVDAAAARAQEVAKAREAAGGGSDTDEVITLARRSPIVAALGGIASATALGVVIVWLGLGLTAAGMLLVACVAVAPLLLFDGTRTTGIMLGGAVVLAGAFSVLSRAIRAAMSGGRPWLAVARNVLAEAVRMKISLVFIVMLIFLLAGLPFFLNPEQPLRYRVQLFLQYGTGGTFWVLALLTVFFSVASVAFEQRDKIIWQTMTKPVPPWQYLLGKWAGVAALNTALLGVAAAGVFLFTEHLRAQPAQGEVRPFVNADDPSRPTIDRVLLETQVLSARRGMQITIPEINKEAVDAEVARRVKDRMDILARTPFVQQEAPMETMFRTEIINEIIAQYRSIEPGQSQVYTFSGLGHARDTGRPLTLRYRFNSGTDNPSNIYRVVFIIGGVAYIREAAINVSQTVEFPAGSIDDQGVLTVQIINGDPTTNRVNLRPISFPPDGMEVLYTAGSYEANFLRVAAVLWLKLAFLAAVGVAAATFLSFPVACLVSMGVFLVAESSSFLVESLDLYASKTEEGVNYFAMVIRAVAVPLAYGFEWYGDLRPTQSLVDGRMLSWGSLSGGAALLIGSSVLVLGIGLLIFRKRELALYSGK